jgi:hypothetical protein
VTQARIDKLLSEPPEYFVFNGKAKKYASLARIARDGSGPFESSL